MFAFGGSGPRLADACHGHAGAFARETLTLVDGVLRGAQSGRDISAFLPTHRGRPTPDETALLVDLFRRQVGWAGLFQARCRVCHDSARALARQRLIVRDGALRGRYSGRDIARFLARHGRTTAAERQILHEVLVWQLEAAGGSD